MHMHTAQTSCGLQGIRPPSPAAGPSLGPGLHSTWPPGHRVPPPAPRHPSGCWGTMHYARAQTTGGCGGGTQPGGSQGVCVWGGGGLISADKGIGRSGWFRTRLGCRYCCCYCHLRNCCCCPCCCCCCCCCWNPIVQGQATPPAAAAADDDDDGPHITLPHLLWCPLRPWQR